MSPLNELRLVGAYLKWLYWHKIKSVLCVLLTAQAIVYLSFQLFAFIADRMAGTECKVTQ